MSKRGEKNCSVLRVKSLKESQVESEAAQVRSRTAQVESEIAQVRSGIAQVESEAARVRLRYHSGRV